MSFIKPMLAKPYDGQEITGWLMSEKLDGVRAIWDGENLTSRNGNVFSAPDWFTASLPKNVSLDGELWEGRGLFQKTVGKIRSSQGDWSNVIYMVFDTVTNAPFIQRLDALHALDLPAHCKVVRHERCESQKHLSRFERGVLAAGGEGVMLRASGSTYEHKRSQHLLKLKRFYTDEAIVIDHTKGEGKHTGRVGALVCQWKGKKFQIGTGLSDALRSSPPSIGKAVTFSYFETTDGGVPRFPSFISCRDYE